MQMICTAGQSRMCLNQSNSCNISDLIENFEIFFSAINRLVLEGKDVLDYLQ